MKSSGDRQIDILSEVLQWLRVEGSTYGRIELTAPWGFVPACNGPVHFHLVDRGSCFLVMQNRAPISLTAGDVVLLVPEQEYSLVDDVSTQPLTCEELFHKEEEPAAHSDDKKSCPVRIAGGGGANTTLMCGAFHFELGDEHPILSLLPKVMHISREDQQATPWLEVTIRFLAYEASRREQGFDTAIAKLVDLLFIQIMRAWQAIQPSGEGGWFGALRDESIGKALGLLHREPHYSWTVESLGKAVGLSRSGFAARFQTLVGMPPLQYLTQWRMQIAACLLQQRKLNIGQIALQVGYDSEKSFSRAFKRIYKTTPGSWRKQQTKHV